MKKSKRFLKNFIDGFCMSLADSVPGVSGGTVAFVLGFYDKFIISLDDLFHGNLKTKKEAFRYLIKIGIGWVCGFLLAILCLANLFDSHIYLMSSLFIGFILFAIPIVIKEEKDSLKGKYYNLFFLLLGMGLVILITYLNLQSGNNFNMDNFNLGTIIYVFLAASLAISAMILPGISGSTLLLIFGIYIPIITKIKSLLNFDLQVLPIIIVFGLGMIFGIIFFTKLLRKSLEKRRSATIYTILGMMIASVYSIVMGPTTLDVSQKSLSFQTFNIWFFLLGGLIIWGLELLKKLLRKN